MSSAKRIREWWAARPVLSSALELAAAVPGILVASLLLTLSAVWTTQAVAGPRFTPSLWMWLLLPAIAAVPLWLVVSHVLRTGGWRGVASGASLLAALGVAAWLLGLAEQSAFPANGMSGVGEVILAAMVGVSVPSVLVMAVVASVLAKRAGTRPPA